jgi:hypothetical protein
MSTTRTHEEIVKRIEERKEEDFFGDEISDYLKHLPFEAAKAYLKEDVTEKEWEETYEPLERDKLLAWMEEYMHFAWGKAKDCRGLSANRSIHHYIAWTWLIGDEGLSKALTVPYEFYGKDHLVMVCKHYGWNSERWDDHRRVNSSTE